MTEMKKGAKPLSSNSRLSVLETAVGVLLERLGQELADPQAVATVMALRAGVLRQGHDTGWYKPKKDGDENE